MSDKKPYQEQYVTADRAAELLGLNPRTIREWASDPDNGIARNRNRNYGLISLLQLAIARRLKQSEKVDPQINLLSAQTAKTEIETQILQHKRNGLSKGLVDADEVATEWSKHQEKVEDKLNQLVSKLPEKLEEQLPSAIVSNLSPTQKRELASRWEEKIRNELIDILE